MAIEVRSLADQVFDLVRQKIVLHEIQPGEAIRQDALAAEFGTSKIPIREALARLQGVGLVQSAPNRGFFAPPLSLQEVDDIFSTRMLIEPQTAAESAMVATAPERAKVLAARNELARASDFKSSVNARRMLLLSLLIRPELPIRAMMIIQVFDRSERYHPRKVSIDFLDIDGLNTLVSAWLEKDAQEVSALFRARLKQRAEMARASISALLATTASLQSISLGGRSAIRRRGVASPKIRAR